MTDPDPRNLIADAYAMPELGVRECRSIFLDWVLGLPDGLGYETPIREMLSRHGAAAPEHPMTSVLTEGLAAGPRPRRRGRKARRRS